MKPYSIYRNASRLIATAVCCLALPLAVSCADDPKEDSVIYDKDDSKSLYELDTLEYVYLLEEGNWQSDNGQMSLITNGSIHRDYFSEVNGTKIGDTPEDVIVIPGRNMLAISVNWSNIVYFTDLSGKIIGQTEDIPNCRHMCTDGDYVYISSYAHKTALGETYEKGYLAKIRISDFTEVATCEVGWEPEGVAYYDGKVFVANTGGYAFSENHDYDNTVMAVDAATMKVTDTVSIVNKAGDRVINLYGEMSQSGEYLCINSPGDYYDVQPSTVIFNCKTLGYKVFDGIPATYNTTLLSGKFFVIGSTFSYYTGEYLYNVGTIDPATGEYTEEGFENAAGLYKTTIKEVVDEMTNPYCCYQNPYTGHVYVVDAATYASPGKVYEFDEMGVLVPVDGKKFRRCYINAGHMIAIDPELVRSNNLN